MGAYYPYFTAEKGWDDCLEAMQLISRDLKLGIVTLFMLSRIDTDTKEGLRRQGFLWSQTSIQCDLLSSLCLESTWL